MRKNSTKLSVLSPRLDRRELMHVAIASACVGACADISMLEDGGDAARGMLTDVPPGSRDGSDMDGGLQTFDVPNAPDVPNGPDVPGAQDVPNSMDVPNRRDVPTARDVPTGDTSAGCAPPGFQRVGAVASFPIGMFTFRAAGHYFVGHDARGLYALTSVCTHRGCDVNVTGGGTFLCPCHSATYDANGAVTGGPAPRSLDHYAVVVCGGAVYVNPAMIVPANTRTAP